MQKIPLATVESMFKRTEVPIEVLQSCLNAFKSQNVQAESWVGDLMLTLTKADNFDMTIMFCEDSDKALVAEIANKQSDKKKAKDIKSKYQCD